MALRSCAGRAPTRPTKRSARCRRPTGRLGDRRRGALGAVARARLSLAIQRSAIDEAIDYGQQAVAAIPGEEWRLRTEALATLGRAWALRGQPDRASSLVREAEQQLHANADPELRCLVLNASAHRHLTAGQLHQAAADAQQARRLVGAHPSLEGAHAAVRLSEVYRECEPAGRGRGTARGSAWRGGPRRSGRVRGSTQRGAHPAEACAL